MGVESRDSGTGEESTGDDAVLQVKFVSILAFLGVGLHDVRATGTGVVTEGGRVGTGTESGTGSSESRVVSTGNKRNLLKRGYRSGCLAAALASIRIKNPP